MESSNYFDIFFQWSVASRNYPISLFVSMLRVLQQSKMKENATKRDCHKACKKEKSGFSMWFE
jgi:hypothetical protein